MARHVPAWLGLATALVLAAAPALAGADASGATTSAGRVPVPAIAAARGDKCVAEPVYMRRHHMKLLKHQRDDTVHRGERETKFALKGCVDCHASDKTGSVAAAAGDFCVSCHSYAAVTLDCFECHSARPGGTSKAAANPHKP